MTIVKMIVDIAHELSKYPSSTKWIMVIDPSLIFGETRKITTLIVTMLLSKKKSRLFQKLTLLRGNMILKKDFGKLAPREVDASSIDISIFFIFVIVESIPRVKL